MSEMEYNKGRTIPVTWNVVKYEFPDEYIDDLEYYADGKFETINGEPCLIEEEHGVNDIPEQLISMLMMMVSFILKHTITMVDVTILKSLKKIVD